MTAPPNCAIHYIPEAYQGDKRGVVGRQSAGAGFLDALIRHGRVERLYGVTNDAQHAAAFRDRIGAVDPAMATSVLDPFDAAAIGRAGCLFTPGPLIAESAWLRRFGGERSYSLCGITHSVATERVIRSIRDVMVAPTQCWDALICTSQAARAVIGRILEVWTDYLASRGFTVGPQPVRFPVIPLGVHVDDFARDAAADERAAALRTRLGVEAGDIVLLHFGRFDFRSKSHPTPLFRAVELARYRHRRSRLHLLMVGQFADAVNAHEFRVAQHLYCPSVPVHWIDGADTELARTSWAAADIFVSLSDNVQESFGMTPVEAMAAGLPAVVSDWNGYRETVIDGETGIRVPTLSAPAGAGIDLADDHAQHRFDHFTLIAHTAQSTAVDIDAGAEAIARLAGDEALRRRMGEAGRRRAETVYDWRHIIAAYQALWLDLAAARDRAAALGERRAGRHTVHPDYPDLFALFAGHAGALLDDDMVVGWADADAPYGVRRSRLLQIDLFSDPVMLDGRAIDRLVEGLAGGPRRVGDIAADIGTADRARLQRSLLRLYKFGILKIGRQP